MLLLRALAVLIAVDAAPATEPPSLEGTAWVLADLPGQAAGARPASVRFEGGRASGFDGCNGFLKALASVAQARVDGDRLELRTAEGTLAVQLVRQ